MSELPPFAEPLDVAAIWHELSAAEDSIVAERLAEASRMVRDDVPLVGGLDVDERIEAGLLSSETVRRVVVAMVHRVVSIPGYVRQRSVTVDDATEAVTYDSSVSGGEMFITDREMQRLTGRPARRQRAFTITLGPGASWI
jgi:hypothetical protein